MKKHLLGGIALCLLGICVVLSGYFPWGLIRISLSSESQIHKSDDIKIDYRVENSLPIKIVWYDSFQEYEIAASYELTLYGPDGKEVLTKWAPDWIDPHPPGKLTNPRSFTSGDWISGSRDYSFNLAYWFPIERLGKYTLQMSAGPLETGRFGKLRNKRIESNKLEFEIIP